MRGELRGASIVCILRTKVGTQEWCWQISSGASWLRRGSRNRRGMPRGSIPRKSNCKQFSCQRRQLRTRCL